MPRPDWMVEAERRREIDSRLKRCVNCRHLGQPVGLTNNLGDGRGRATMFACALHPKSIPIHFGTYACEDYQRR